MAVEDRNPDTQSYPPHSKEGSTRSVDDVTRELVEHEELDNRSRIKVGIGLGLTAVGLVIGEFMTQRYGANIRLSHTLPFLASAQNAINHIDDTLVPVGEYGIPAAIGLVAGVKAWSPFNNLARFADTFSGREPNADNSSPKYSFGSLRRKVGSVSLALAGAGLATFTAAVATEVGNGPDRALDTLDSLVPGSSVVVEYPKAMPMVESVLNRELEAQIRKIASRDNIASHPFALNLGTYESNGHSNTDLIAGIETKPG
ncbi:MAG TPA: hypothetical protein VNX65_03800, partial [Patescibacteria group bacterium]|nr:hypothetical protein [Patescibacteria group bacterium]